MNRYRLGHQQYFDIQEGEIWESKDIPSIFRDTTLKITYIHDNGDCDFEALDDAKLVGRLTITGIKKYFQRVQ